MLYRVTVGEVANFGDVGLASILLATDFSSSSQRALEYAATIARHYDSILHIVHVVCPETQEFVSITKKSSLDRAREDAERAMAAFLKSDVLRAVSYSSIVRENGLEKVLRQLVQSRDAGLIVLTTQGRSGSSWKMTLGTFTDYLGRNICRPVLLLGPNVTRDPENVAINRVLFATDMREATLKALPYAISIAEKHRAQLRLLHFLPGARAENREQASLEWQLREHVRLKADFTREPEFVVDYGEPVSVIRKSVAEQGSDIVVFGEYTRDEGRVHLRPSPAFELVSECPSPVLVVLTSSPGQGNRLIGK